MARSYTKLYVTISSDPDFLPLSLEAKFLYLMILAMPKLSAAGCVEYRPSRWTRLDATMTVNSIDQAVGELSRSGFVVFDESTDELLVRAWIRRDNGVKNKNLRKSVTNAIAEIESRSLQRVARAEFARATTEDLRTDSEQAASEGPDDDPDKAAIEPNSSKQPTDDIHQLAADTVRDPLPGNAADANAAAAEFDEFDQAINAALAVRRSQTTVTNEDRWAPATRAGLVKDYGHKIRQHLDAGQGPINAGRLAIGAEPLATARPPREPDHSDRCVCDGTGWVQVDEGEGRASVVARCDQPQTEATIHQFPTASGA